MKIPITAAWMQQAVERMWCRWEIVQEAVSYGAEQSVHPDMINWLRHPRPDNLFFRYNLILCSIWTDTTLQQVKKSYRIHIYLGKMYQCILAVLINLLNINNINTTIKYFRKIHSLRNSCYYSNYSRCLNKWVQKDRKFILHSATNLPLASQDCSGKLYCSSSIKIKRQNC